MNRGSATRPLAFAALVVLVVNDHLLKGSAVPGVVTGKLSDLAGVLLLPVVLAVTWQALGGRASRGAAWAGVAVTAVVFVAIQVSSVADAAFEATLAFLRWLPAATVAQVLDAPVPRIVPVVNVRDLTDLLVLPAALLPALLWGRCRRAVDRVPRENGEDAEGPVDGPAPRVTVPL